MSVKTVYEFVNQRAAELELPVGNEGRLRDILPNSPPITKDEIIEKEFNAKTEEILNSLFKMF